MAAPYQRPGMNLQRLRGTAAYEDVAPHPVLGSVTFSQGCYGDVPEHIPPHRWTMIISFAKGKGAPMTVCGDSVPAAIQRAKSVVREPASATLTGAEWDEIEKQIIEGWDEVEILEATEEKFV
jgi:hypothetical protein